MGEVEVFIITIVLLSIIFRFLLSVFNSRIWGVFVPMQRDLGKISKINLGVKL